MRFISGLFQRLKAKYLNFSLRSKISFVLIASVSIVCGLVMLASYASTHYLIINYTHALLNRDAMLEKRELEIKLSAEIQSANDFANNFITANALADTQESTLYLVPFLKSQQHAFAHTGLSVVDYRGRLIASNLDQQVNYEGHPLLKTMMEVAHPQSAILTKNNQPVLLHMVPVRYQLTNEIEGAVVLEIPLQFLLSKNTSHHVHWLVDNQQRVVAGNKPALDNLIVSSEHGLNVPLSGIKLAYFLAHDRTEALQKINLLLAGYLIIALIAVAGLLAFARRSARYISKPLEQLSQVAHEVTSIGRPQSYIDIATQDEYGALAEAFNMMFERLDDTYRNLETRVKERTAELENAKADAERSRNLLHEAVASATTGFCIFDQEDRLVVFNEAYRQFTQLGDFVQVGRSYLEIKQKLAAEKIFPDSADNAQDWIASRLAHHQKADASVLELKRHDGRWFMLQEVRSPSGYVIASRIDITALKLATTALAQRELYLQATLDNLPFLFWLKDAESRFLAINQVFADACGLQNPEDAVGKTDYDVWPKTLAEQYRADDIEVMASMREKHVEEPMDASYGSTWIETYKKPVMTDDGRVMGTVGFARDIGDRKTVELALAEAQMRWSLAMRGANDGVWDWNLQTDKVYFSDRWKTMLGYEIDEIKDLPDEWKSRVHPEDYQRSIELLEAHLRGETEFYNNEHRLRCKDGSYKWILARGKAFIDEHGKPIRITGSHTDISDKKMADAIIMDRTQQLDEIFALSPDGFVSFDQHGQFKYANPAFLQLTGLEAGKLKGLKEAEFSLLLADQCKPDGRFIGIAALRGRLAATEMPQHNEAGSNKINGQIVELAGPGNRLLEISLKMSRSETVSEILYVRDVTHEVEVSRIKSEFLSTAAHELRTPMSSIYGYSELLLARPFNADQQREFHEIIHKQAALVSEILNELLDLQRIESRRGKDFVLIKLDLAELIKETVAMYKIPAGRTAPKILLPNASAHIRADRSKMIQVINNVLSNAYKYSPAGGDVEIEVVAEASPEKAELIGIRIADHGIGMTTEQLARVCERFYRADTSGLLPGTGLGMSIVKEIVELHHGYVDLSSQYGVGTTVTLWLPLEVKHESNAV